MTHEALVVLIVWIAGGAFTYGTTFAYYQGVLGRNAPSHRYRDMAAAFLSSLAGPFGPVLAFFSTERFKYGFRFW